MADVIKEGTLKNHDTGVSSVSNYIHQIAAGDVTYDIATHHSITFHDGQTDTSGTAWNGITDLDVYIPSIADLVTDPVRLAGTCAVSGSAYTVTDGVVTKKDSYTAKKGDLIFIGTSCTFEGIACEAGDMAIFDGTSWTVVSGENQVTISGVVDGKAEFALKEAAQTVLTVEGKTLSLKLDYADIKTHLSVTKAAAQTIDVKDGTVAVSGIYVGLSKAADTTADITTSVSIDLPTALASGAVTINESVLQKSDFTWTSGTNAELSKNTTAISVDASTNVAINKTTGSDFVSSITGDVISSVAITASDAQSTGAIKFATGISASDGTSFVSGVHTATTEAEKAEGSVADFAIPGAYSLSGVTTFASKFGDAAESGEVLSSISVGAVTVDTAASSFLAGLNTTGSDVVTSVTFGSAVQDTDTSWFVTGLGDGSDVITSVSVGTVSLAADAGSSFASSVMSAASVNDHVLSFGTTSVMTPVKVSQAATTVTSKGFNKGGVKLSGFSYVSGGFDKAGISQAATTVSYKSLMTGTVSLSQGDATKYFFDKTASKEYSAVNNYLTLSTTGATVNTSAYELTNTGITASIPANTVVTGFSVAPVLPTLTIADTATGTLTGTVGTSLTTTNVSWLAVDDSKKTVVTAAGAYTLVSSDTSETGYIEVAKVSSYSVDDATITIASNLYVSDVDVITTTDTSAE